ncbi:MAG TPA: hypothetical protein VFH71_04420 [Rhodanobacteraceae bacterium]|nr:hypothetical protein [Rhodanobacteraceae bacterium]
MAAAATSPIATRRDLEFHLAARDPRHVQQVVHHIGDVAHLLFDDAALGAERVRRAQLHEMQRGDDRRERIAQLVAEHRQELVLGAIGFRQRLLGAHAMGDVQHRGHDGLGPALPITHQRHTVVHPHDGAVLADVALLDLERHALFPATAELLQVARQVLRMGDVLHLLPQDLFARVAQHFAIARVGGDDATVEIRLRHTRDHLVEERAVALLGFAQRRLHARTLGGFDHGDEEPCDCAGFIAQRAVTELEPRRFGRAAAIEGCLHASRRGLAGGQHRFQDRPDLRPERRPAFASRLAQRSGMHVPEHRGNSVVVKLDQPGSPPHVGGERRIQRDLHRRLQRLRPLFHRAERVFDQSKARMHSRTPVASETPVTCGSCDSLSLAIASPAANRGVPMSIVLRRKARVRPRPAQRRATRVARVWSFTAVAAQCSIESL